MNNKFDELTKSLAQSVTRRAVLKFGVGVAGMALACFGTHRLKLRHGNAFRMLMTVSIIAFLYMAHSAFGTDFIVTTTADSGPGSLRQAINDANSNPGTDRIKFNIPGTGPQTISPITNLPPITEALVIDGSTQPLASATNLLIHLNGTNLTNVENGLQFQSFGCAVSNLVVERFPFDGIFLSSGGNNQIYGNVVRSNAAHGIEINGSQGNVVLNNVITDNGEGVALFGGSHLNTISNNRIGIDDTGIVRPNNLGVEVECSPNNVVSGNIVVGNSSTGIIIRRLNSTGNVLEYNYITNNGGDGLRVYDQAANTKVYNNDLSHNGSDGVLVFTNALNTTVTNNTITFNGGNGVHVAGAGTLGVAIVRNSIYSNGKLGIDLGGICNGAGAFFSCTDDGVTENDPGDTDTGPNNLQNFPVLTTITYNVPGTAEIQGSLTSTANRRFRLEFFANTVPNVSGYYEGETFLGSAEFFTVSDGYFYFVVSFPANDVTNRFITATATDLTDNNTSEFSAALLSNLPGNDQCGGAIAMAAGITYRVNTFLATSTGDPTPSCLPGFGKGVWYTFTPLINGLVAISTCGSDFDTKLQIYTGVCGGSLTPVICNEDNGPLCGGNAASVAFNGTAGTTYWILAGGCPGDNCGGNLSIVAWVAGLVPSLLYPQWNAGQFSFRLLGEPGRVFEILAASNLDQPAASWSSIGTVTNLSGVTGFTDPSANLSRRYYRAQLLP